MRKMMTIVVSGVVVDSILEFSELHDEAPDEAPKICISLGSLAGISGSITPEETEGIITGMREMFAHILGVSGAHDDSEEELYG